MEIVDVILRSVESELRISRYPTEDAWNDMRCKFPLGYLQSLHDNMVTDETFKAYQYLHSPDLFL